MRTFVRTYKRSTTIGKIKVIELTDKERLQLEEGFRLGRRHSFRMRCRAILLKSNGLTSKDVGIQTEMTHISVNSWVKRFECEGFKGLDFLTVCRSVSAKGPLQSLTTQVYTDAGLCGNFVPYGRSRGGSFSFSLLIAHILILPRLFGTSSRENGSDLWIISTQTPCSMPPTEPWRQSGLDSESILTMCLV